MINQPERGAFLKAGVRSLPEHSGDPLVRALVFAASPTRANDRRNNDQGAAGARNKRPRARLQYIFPRGGKNPPDEEADEEGGEEPSQNENADIS